MTREKQPITDRVKDEDDKDQDRGDEEDDAPPLPWRETAGPGRQGGGLRKRDGRHRGLSCSDRLARRFLDSTLLRRVRPITPTPALPRQGGGSYLLRLKPNFPLPPCGQGYRIWPKRRSPLAPLGGGRDPRRGRGRVEGPRRI